MLRQRVNPSEITLLCHCVKFDIAFSASPINTNDSFFLKQRFSKISHKGKNPVAKLSIVLVKMWRKLAPFCQMNMIPCVTLYMTSHVSAYDIGRAWQTALQRNNIKCKCFIVIETIVH